MKKPQVFRITNYMFASFADSFVSAGERTQVDLERAVAFIGGYVSQHTDGGISLSNAEVADLLTEFYGFQKADGDQDVREIDVSMTLKEYSLLGRWEPGFWELLKDPTLNSDLVTRRIEALIEAICEEAFA